ncbi:hypothetical protein AN964_18480 [Heyndrickxia shackletonii]|uniref:Uncharacterized protein n=1 Tax=Heyndrickxia shackletonii TaxID=157838 RepID=A0A0Q3TA94_9BACI|nr:hypothetical protein [Heyndrickxia shackletonii]KQL51016.1 hypothetical protein AN964_18480 [Heyndrickxia shackletonii]MBB2481863.1 hypothetical protein [Bacillus sp. APMAM]NEZ02024.1 hypothetical protein [Heyndrickxia shackletonii]RTZ54791.1 hypothetical protein EKO25_16180 [Bacillus sp. SAJ1]
MFSLKGLLSTLGIALICTVVVSFLIGLLNIKYEFLGVSIIFLISYVVTGITAPLWNPKTPYFSSYLSSLFLTILNFFAALYVLDVNVLFNPDGVNNSLVLSSMTSLITTFIVVQIMKRKQVNKYD